MTTAETPRTPDDRLAAAVARAEAAEAKVAAVEALPFYGADLFGTEVESVVRSYDLRAALGSAATEEPILRAHNHPPHRPTCAERFVDTATGTTLRAAPASTTTGATDE